MTTSPELSVVVPFFNEQESIEPLYRALLESLEHTDYRFELIFVDDGSADETFAIGARLAESDPRLKLIRFRRNCGQTPAMAAGIDHASGDVVVTLDGDLQNDPRDIPLLVDKIHEGFDIAVGWRFNRQDKLVTRKIPSRIANWIIGKVTGVPIKDNGCSLKAYRASVIKEVPLYSEMHRFIPAMTSIAGARIAELRVRHHARQFGESKYGLSRIYKVLIDLLTIKMVTSFAARPLYWFVILSLPFVATFLVSAVNAVASASGGSTWQVFAGTSVVWASLAFFLLAAGVLGQMIYQFGDFTVERLYRFTAASSRSGHDSTPDNRTENEGNTR